MAQARQLRDEIMRSNRQLAAALKRLDALARRANRALQAYGKAAAAERAAQETADENRRKSETLQARLNAGRTQMQEWAFNVYTQGGSYSDALALFQSLATGVDGPIYSPVGDLVFITDERLRVLEQIRELEAQQRTVTREAVAAEREAVAARATAETARDAAKRAVRQHKQALKHLQTTHAATLTRAAPLYAVLLGLGNPDAQSAAESLRAALQEAGATISDLAVTPCSDNTKVYPNGQIPPSALCPMVGSTDEYLRPAAAAAFNAMSRAYARDTGHLLCVVDGYRSYAEQVIVKAQKGKWAATPGTSEHGYGLAVDLCGGVESFGSAAHLWMKQNAPLYGWFHPAWAEPNGPLPEPWHWEFAG